MAADAAESGNDKSADADADEENQTRFLLGLQNDGENDSNEEVCIAGTDDAGE